MSKYTPYTFAALAEEIDSCEYLRVKIIKPIKCGEMLSLDQKDGLQRCIGATINRVFKCKYQ